ncbi:MAG: hypothetical protein HY825_14185 [Acidobacteria bacterium]|nr:hypothetical protein [Acidobacteriota bacterium]
MLNGVGALSVLALAPRRVAAEGPPIDPPEFSNAVVDFVFKDFSDIYMYPDGQPTAAQLDRLSADTMLLFKHFEEVGLNSGLQQTLAADPLAVIDYVPDPATVSTIQGVLSDRGISISASAITSWLGTPEERSQGAAQVLQNGVLATATSMAQTLSEQASYLRGELPFPAPDRPGICDGLQLIIAVLWIGCVLGVGPYCVGAAMVGLLYAMLHWYGMC